MVRSNYGIPTLMGSKCTYRAHLETQPLSLYHQQARDTVVGEDKLHPPPVKMGSIFMFPPLLSLKAGRNEASRIGQGIPPTFRPAPKHERLVAYGWGFFPPAKHTHGGGEHRSHRRAVTCRAARLSVSYVLALATAGLGAYWLLTHAHALAVVRTDPLKHIRARTCTEAWHHHTADDVCPT